MRVCRFFKLLIIKAIRCRIGIVHVKCRINLHGIDLALEDIGRNAFKGNRIDGIAFVRGFLEIFVGIGVPVIAHQPGRNHGLAGAADFHALQHIFHAYRKSGGYRHPCNRSIVI